MKTEKYQIVICEECDKKFVPGDRIILDKNGYYHADCLTAHIFG